MILKCITNWHADATEAETLEESVLQTTTKSVRTDAATRGIEKRLGILPEDHPWDEVGLGIVDPVLGPREQYHGEPSKDERLLNHTEEAYALMEAKEIGTVTLMGPPKEYYGASDRDRFAYMVHEAVSLLHKHGFSTNMTTLRHQAKMNGKKSKRQDNQYHRVPGILGFLLNDMTATTKIAIFEPEHDELFAYLGFMTYKQPWLKICCRSYLPEHAQVIDLLRLILSKRFILVSIPHGSKVTVFHPLKKQPTKEGTEISLGESNGLVIKRTTGVAGSTSAKERLWTMFVLQKDQTVIAKALWSYACQGLDLAGPTMEMFETMPCICDSAMVPGFLRHMEDYMIQTCSPLVAFHLRFCRVEDQSDVSRWFSQRGYAQSKQVEAYLHKAFVVF
ncbi:expressed unknown protein [Seminavis robusta]|uniref:Uncharacterized protein n=1 Tax=Seminavis robusta TaxID=568900 RepID=A0A9N8DWI0_9STRA|nr:expressed unknown protein [Seminavis robusta]|eukprot:Sro333_g119620.1 n/a (391) ;mRNA; f:53953-55125